MEGAQVQYSVHRNSWNTWNGYVTKDGTKIASVEFRQVKEEGSITLHPEGQQEGQQLAVSRVVKDGTKGWQIGESPVVATVKRGHKLSSRFTIEIDGKRYGLRRTKFFGGKFELRELKDEVDQGNDSSGTLVAQAKRTNFFKRTYLVTTLETLPAPLMPAVFVWFMSIVDKQDAMVGGDAGASAGAGAGACAGAGAF